MPKARAPAATPESIDAVPGKVEMIALQVNAIWGKIKPTADIHPAGTTA